MAAVTTTQDKPCEDDDSAPSTNFSCLPKDVRADEVVSYDVEGKPSLTVKKKLIELKAHCRRGKLVDAKGREIRFFRISCWGNPPEDYLEIQKREGEELAELKKHYTVIEFGCDPGIHEELTSVAASLAGACDGALLVRTHKRMQTSGLRPRGGQRSSGQLVAFRRV